MKEVALWNVNFARGLTVYANLVFVVLWLGFFVALIVNREWLDAALDLCGRRQHLSQFSVELVTVRSDRDRYSNHASFPYPPPTGWAGFLPLFNREEKWLQD